MDNPAPNPRLAEILRNAQAIIFDFDGVILESADIKTEAFLDLFNDYPEHRETIRRHHLDNLGISRYHKFEWIYRELLRRPLDESQKQTLGERFSALIHDKMLACPFVPGSLDALRHWHGRLPLFVASGTPETELCEIVRLRELEVFFEEIGGAPRSKPDIITHILFRHGFEPGRTVMIGDGASDLDAARKTGLPFIARVPDARARWASGADVAVPDLHPLAVVDNPVSTG